MRFQAETDHGVELVEVVAVDDATVTVDANHPLGPSPGVAAIPPDPVRVV